MIVAWGYKKHDRRWLGHRWSFGIRFAGRFGGGDAGGWGACLGVLWRWSAGAVGLTVALGTGLRTRYPWVGDDDVPVKVADLGGAVKFPITRRAV